MDVYCFAREITDGALERLFGLVDGETVRFAMPTAGEFGAYAAISHDDPGEALAAARAVAAVEGLGGVDILVGVVPIDSTKNLDRQGDPFDAIALSSAAWDPIPPIPPVGPIPTRGRFDDWVALTLLTCAPGTTTRTYVEATALPGLVGLAVVHGMSPLVLVELGAPTEGQLAVAVDLAGTIDTVDSLSSSIGHASLARRALGDAPTTE